MFPFFVRFLSRSGFFLNIVYKNFGLLCGRSRPKVKYLKFLIIQKLKTPYRKHFFQKVLNLTSSLQFISQAKSQLKTKLYFIHFFYFKIKKVNKIQRTKAIFIIYRLLLLCELGFLKFS